MMMRQCHADQGSASSRAGISLRTIVPCGSAGNAFEAGEAMR
jgi:hypothetical protein